MEIPAVVTMIGSGGIGAALLALAREVIKRRVPDLETTEARDTKRIEQREANLDAAYKAFQDSVYRELDQSRKLHDKCEENRRIDHQECEAKLLAATEKTANLAGRVEFFEKSLDNLRPGAQNGKATSHRKTKAR